MTTGPEDVLLAGLGGAGMRGSEPGDVLGAGRKDTRWKGPENVRLAGSEDVGMGSEPQDVLGAGPSVMRWEGARM